MVIYETILTHIRRYKVFKLQMIFPELHEATKQVDFDVTWLYLDQEYEYTTF